MLTQAASLPSTLVLPPPISHSHSYIEVSRGTMLTQAASLPSTSEPPSRSPESR